MLGVLAVSGMVGLFQSLFLCLRRLLSRNADFAFAVEYGFSALLYHLCERRIGCFSFGIYGAVFALYAFPTVLIGLSSGWTGLLFSAVWMLPRSFWLVKGIFSPAEMPDYTQRQKRRLLVQYAVIAFAPAVSLVPTFFENAPRVLVYGSLAIGILACALAAFFLFPRQKRRGSVLFYLKNYIRYVILYLRRN